MSNQEVPPVPPEFMQTFSELQEEVTQLEQEQATSSVKTRLLISEMQDLTKGLYGEESQPEVIAQLNIKMAELIQEDEKAAALQVKIHGVRAKALAFTGEVQSMLAQLPVPVQPDA